MFNIYIGLIVKVTKVVLKLLILSLLLFLNSNV
jgi:hypothetical protein